MPKYICYLDLVGLIGLKSVATCQDRFKNIITSLKISNVNIYSVFLNSNGA